MRTAFCRLMQGGRAQYRLPRLGLFVALALLPVPDCARINACMRHFRNALLISLLLIPHIGRAEIKGYLKHLNSVVVIPERSDWLLSGMVHNRIDANWRCLSGMQVVLGLRNRLIYGDLVQLIPQYAQTLEYDPSYWKWSRLFADEHSYVLNSMIDRAYIDYTHKAWQVRFGRQRINWGMNLIWNPNDLFNNYSLMDFDYEERPGRDAVLATWYTGPASYLQVVYQPARSADESVIVGLYRLNRWGYDLQLLTGRWVRDWVVGAGWSGQVAGGAFRGEWTWFHPREEKSENDVWVTSISGDYTLRNGLYGQISILYNSSGKTKAAGSIDFIGEQLLTAKNLTRGRLNGFIQLRYPITPLVTADAAAIYNPFDHSWFFAPSLAFSFIENIDFLLIGQFLTGDPGSEFGANASVCYTRLKWSF